MHVPGFERGMPGGPLDVRKKENGKRHLTAALGILTVECQGGVTEGIAPCFCNFGHPEAL